MHAALKNIMIYHGDDLYPNRERSDAERKAIFAKMGGGSSAAPRQQRRAASNQQAERARQERHNATATESGSYAQGGVSGKIKSFLSRALDIGAHPYTEGEAAWRTAIGVAGSMMLPLPGGKAKAAQQGKRATSAADQIISQARQALSAPQMNFPYRKNTPALDVIRQGKETLKADSVNRLGYVDFDTSEALRALDKEELAIRMMRNRSLQLIVNAVKVVTHDYIANRPMSDSQRRAMFAKLGGSAARVNAPKPDTNFNRPPGIPPDRDWDRAEGVAPPGYHWGKDPKTGRTIPIKNPAPRADAPIARMPGIIDDTKKSPKQPGGSSATFTPRVPTAIPINDRGMGTKTPPHSGKPGQLWPGGTPPWIYDESIGGPNPNYPHPDNPNLGGGRKAPPASKPGQIWAGGTPPWIYDEQIGGPNLKYPHPDNPNLGGGKRKQPVNISTPWTPPGKSSGRNTPERQQRINVLLKRLQSAPPAEQRRIMDTLKHL
jgi:hypothetical protein